MKAYLMTPTCKDYIWGGDKLIKEWNKKPDKTIVAECWELSCHEQGASYVDSTTVTLRELIANNPHYLGKKVEKFADFPMLIKLIDSRENLSIQVHPSDDYALAKEGQYGKTEMWYVVAADNGAGVYCGFSQPESLASVKTMLEQGTICDALKFVECKPGDSLFIEAGTVHAICGGLTICEVQQNSSLTYRLFDYNRTDAQGNTRELHITKSLEVIDFAKVVNKNEGVSVVREGLKKLASSQYFSVYEIKGEFCDNVDENSFVAITCLSDLRVEYTGGGIDCQKGNTVFLPANLGKYCLKGDKVLAIKSLVE